LPVPINSTNVAWPSGGKAVAFVTREIRQENSMRKIFWYIVGGQLATIAIPAFAQDVPEPFSEGMGQGDLTTEQQAAYDLWPDEKQATYTSWPANAQNYFWTLPKQRKDVFWMLRDEDQLALVNMDDIEREAAWADIEKRLTTMSGSPVRSPGFSSFEGLIDDDLAPFEPDDDNAVEPESR
jgi:hypothetical protein